MHAWMSEVLGIKGDNHVLQTFITKNVSLCLVSTVYVVCFVFNMLFGLLFPRNIFCELELFEARDNHFLKDLYLIF